MVILIGPPGAGKSMQAKLLKERGAAHWISVGRLLREHLQGEQHDRLDKGELIEDEVVTALLVKTLNDIQDSDLAVLDGFPRRDSQIEWLFTEANPRKLDGVILLEADRNVLVARLLKRGRDDDTEATINERIDIFYKEIQPILEHFEAREVPIHKIDGNGSIEEVYQLVHSALKGLGVDRI